jgi:FAD binding domain/Berberine and berberine like
MLAAPLARLIAATPVGSEIPAIKASGEATIIEKTAMDEFAASLRGQLILADHPEYETARRIWNRMIDKRPAMIVRCAGAADVASAISFARERGLLLAVRGGGHSFPGYSTCDGGMVIDLSPMKTVRVDLAARSAVAAGGAWGRDVDAETQHYELVTTLGQISDTGIAGLTLGGGYGWLSRKFGLACDNLLSADIVTADGQLRRASHDENPDLFWGIRGGGGNFGVVTAFEYRLHPLKRQVLAGGMRWPIARARTVANFYSEFNERAPRELSLDLSVFILGGERFIAIDGCYAGDVATGTKLLEPLKRLGKPAYGSFQPRNYTAVQRDFDDKPGDPAYHYMKGGLVREFTPEFVTHLARDFQPSAHCFIYMQNASGAVGDVAPDATAFWNRKAICNLMVMGEWRDPAQTDRNRADIRAAFDGLARFTAGYYVNLNDADKSTVSPNYGDNFPRLAALKRKYDAQNLFRLNSNIAPDGKV